MNTNSPEENMGVDSEALILLENWLPTHQFYQITELYNNLIMSAQDDMAMLLYPEELNNQTSVIIDNVIEKLIKAKNHLK